VCVVSTSDHCFFCATVCVYIPEKYVYFVVFSCNVVYIRNSVCTIYICDAVQMMVRIQQQVRQYRVVPEYLILAILSGDLVEDFHHGQENWYHLTTFAAV